MITELYDERLVPPMDPRACSSIWIIGSSLFDCGLLFVSPCVRSDAVSIEMRQNNGMGNGKEPHLMAEEG